MSQTRTVLKHLKTKGSITNLEAVLGYRIMNISERIRELEREGVKIRREPIESVHPGAAGNYVRYHYNGQHENR